MRQVLSGHNNILTDIICARHVTKALKALIKGVEVDEDIADDDLEDMVCPY